MSINHEIEIKTLLGSEENAKNFQDKISEIYPDAEVLPVTKQLNHYFVDGDYESLLQKSEDFFDEEEMKKLKAIIEKGNNFSARTREVDGRVLLVVKASIGDDTSANGVSRMEFEEDTPFSLEKLDELLMSCGFKYQAKWSRERTEYKISGMNICLDKNAGYGYLAEFEKIFGENVDVDEAKNEIISEMNKFGLEELAQDRIERMFDFYNKNWPDYYGTEKTFVIE